MTRRGNLKLLVALALTVLIALPWGAALSAGVSSNAHEYTSTYGPGTAPATSPLKVYLSVSPTGVELPGTVTLTANGSGGSDIYASYFFSCGNGVTQTTAGGKVQSYQCSYNSFPSGNDVVQVSASVTDSTGQTSAAATALVTLYPALNSTTVQLIPSTAYNGTAPFNFSGSLSIGGGHEPFDVQWNWGDGTAAMDIKNTSTTALSEFHVYKVPGNYTLSITVTDSFQRTYTYTHYVLVQSTGGTPTTSPPHGSSSPGLLSGPMLYVIIGVVIAGIVAGVAVVAIRGRHHASPSGETGPSSGGPGPSGVATPGDSETSSDVNTAALAPTTEVGTPETIAASAESSGEGPSVFACPICNTPLPSAEAACPNCTPSLVPPSVEPGGAPPLPGLDETAFTSPQIDMTAASSGPTASPSQTSPPEPSEPASAPPPSDDVFQRLVFGNPEVQTPPSPESETTPSGAAEAKPAGASAERCMVCGGPLKDKFCPTCQMRWD